jgi:membrane-bound lytic murein transglycosylase D
MTLWRLISGGCALLAAACAQLPQHESAVPLAPAQVASGAGENLPAPQTIPMPLPAPAAPAEPHTVERVAQAPRALPPADLWERIRRGFRMPDAHGPLVQEWEKWYSSRPDYVARMVERASRFLFHVVEEVERRGMPSEIALLPMIESAYNPRAYSRSHASGIWQFIPSTGKLYGLRQNFWYDGRRDVLAATGAALDYLQKLHGLFGSWDLALAAYNWGEGAVSRAIARNQAKGLPADYESLAMPNETRNYVPKLQAVKNIVADPARFGLRLAAIPNEPYFAIVTTRRHIDVKLAARLAEIPEEEFRFLNPAHNKPVIRADGSETLVLPRHKVEAFQRNLEAHDKPLVTWQAYIVKRSDKPEAIATKHGITLAQLKEANGIPGNKRIVPGQTLLVPLRGAMAEPHLPDLPAPKLALVRASATKAKCVRAVAGAKKQVPCRAAAKKPPAARQPGQRVNVALHAGG